MTVTGWPNDTSTDFQGSRCTRFKITVPGGIAKSSGRVEIILFEAELAWSTVAVHARERWRRHPGEVAQVVTERLLHLTVEGVRTSGQVVVDEVPRLSIIIFDSQLAKRRILDLQSVAPCKEVAAIQQLQCLRCFRRLRELDHRLEDRLILLERHDLLNGAVSGKDLPASSCGAKAAIELIACTKR